MWTFQGPTVVRTPGGTPRDSFNHILDELDQIPLAYNPNRRNSPSGTAEYDNDGRSLASRRIRNNHTINWGSADTASTLKLAEDGGSSADDVEAKSSTLPLDPPAAVGLWHSWLRETREAVFKRYTWTLFVLCIFVLAVLSIYWGALFRVKENLRYATIVVVDFDGQLSPYEDVVPLVDPAIVRATSFEKLKFDALGFESHPPAEYNFDHLAVRRAVQQEEIWGAIIINANATALLQQAIEIGNSSYDPLGTAQIVYSQAQDVEAYNQYISPVLIRLANDVSASFGNNWTTSVLANASLTNCVRSPQALLPAIGFSIFNLRSFDPPVAIPAVSIGLIYLIIIAFFSFGFFLPTHMLFVDPNPSSPYLPLKFVQLIIYRYLATITAYFFLSFSYSFVSLVFLIPMNHTPPVELGYYPDEDVFNNANPLGRAAFFVYWMLNFFGMGALGLACENVATVTGTPWTALWLIFWVITNVSTGFYALPLSPSFYGWGYAFPLRQVVYASRTLLFGTKNQLGLKFGILAAWVVVGTLFWPWACAFMRWKSVREKTKNGRSE